jgi:hypothetical protein
VKTKCRLVRIIDGDTLVLDVQFSSLPGLNLWAHDLRCRLARIDCPEMRTPEGFAARERMRTVWEHGVFEVDVVKADKYGLRWDVELWCGTTNVNDLMVKDGFAKPYLGDPDMAHDLMPYPTSMPDGWLAELLAIVKDPANIGSPANVHFAWHVGGFALKSFYAEGDGGLSAIGGLAGLAEARELTYEQAVGQLEALQAEGLAAPRAIPWNIVLPILLALLKKWIGV